MLVLRSATNPNNPLLFSCDYIKEQLKFGYSKYIYFKNGYRKFGPAVPHSLIYKKLKPFRTGIERTFGLVKENRIFFINTEKNTPTPDIVD